MESSIENVTITDNLCHGRCTQDRGERLGYSDTNVNVNLCVLICEGFREGLLCELQLLSRNVMAVFLPLFSEENRLDSAHQPREFCSCSIWRSFQVHCSGKSLHLSGVLYTLFGVLTLC